MDIYRLLVGISPNRTLHPSYRNTFDCILKTKRKSNERTSKKQWKKQIVNFSNSKIEKNYMETIKIKPNIVTLREIFVNKIEKCRSKSKNII